MKLVQLLALVSLFLLPSDLDMLSVANAPASSLNVICLPHLLETDLINRCPLQGHLSIVSLHAVGNVSLRAVISQY